MLHLREWGGYLSLGPVRSARRPNALQERLLLRPGRGERRQRAVPDVGAPHSSLPALRCSGVLSAGAPKGATGEGTMVSSLR